MPTADFEKQATRTLEYITESPTIDATNKKLIQAFYRHLLLSGISAARRQKLMAHLKIIAEHTEATPFPDLEKEDIEELVAWIYTRNITESTITDYKQVIKQFWTWMHDGEEPPETAWIQKHRQTHPRLLPQNLLTPHDVEALIESATNERDRAFIALLWETGARIGELIDLRVDDIENSGEQKYVIVDGKTGSRRLLLVESASYLEQWLTVHPNPVTTAFLWCKVDMNQGTPNEQISYQYIRLKILARTQDRAKIEKPVNPHHFRHSRATYLANFLTEAQLCEWFGWVRGSRVPGRYVHLSGRDIDRAYRTTLENQHYHQLGST
ncbi:tyrosine-type recombinase/integrase [Halopiger aswanensis]|uniref:Site-specific recombinase XerD n=1 Tax=Halopiger aswanensis TaxID=148449 RepID=A0A3R7DA46_9EURY|nr:tyrosine-type recombinase/integrase [Halopiger aswanensis]RKD85913.1 site-specific recombinase XerD [Halopiger aswanensis]